MRRIAILLVLATFIHPAFADPNAGLLARYSFEALDNGRVADLSGKGNDLLAQGTLSLCLLYTSPSPRDGLLSRMPSSA